MAQIKTLNWLLWPIQSLKPILFWLHLSVPAKHAPRLILYMQEVFNGGALDELQGLDNTLKNGTDHLLRVLANAGNGFATPTSTSWQEYSTSNIRGAYAYYFDYSERKKGGSRTFSAYEEEWTDLTPDHILASLHEQLAEHVAKPPDKITIKKAQV